jgi:hypothetical protein
MNLLDGAKGLLRRTPLRDVVAEVRRRRSLVAWERAGRPLPPPAAYKRAVVRGYGRAFGLRVLIESGTYRGEMVEAVRKHFAAIHSIELDTALWEAARRRFAGRRNVTVWHGDSGEVIGQILGRVREPALFWLDGHYSEGITAKGDLATPIVAELRHIIGHEVRDHVILVDDARCFDGTQDYPTMAQVTDLVTRARRDLAVTVRDDVIRIHRRSSVPLP